LITVHILLLQQQHKNNAAETQQQCDSNTESCRQSTGHARNTVAAKKRGIEKLDNVKNDEKVGGNA
jgi:hypothetical protein